jgi:sugar phosphate isomerase/epimerase
MPLPIAIQLYTVRTALASDVAGTLQKLAKIGYKHVELAGYCNQTPQQFKKMLDDAGLTAIGAHVGPDGSDANMQKIADEAAIFGYKHIASSGYPGMQWGKPIALADWKAGVAKLATIAGLASKRGLTYCYHNHSFEFDRIEGQRPMDLIYNDAKPAIAAEIDIYWVQHGKDDPLAWMKKLSGRVPLLHVKDMANNAERTFAEVGTGTVPVKQAIALAPQVGVKHLIIEQDGNWKNEDPLLSAKISYDNLKALAG